MTEHLPNPAEHPRGEPFTKGTFEKGCRCPKCVQSWELSVLTQARIAAGLPDPQPKPKPKARVPKPVKPHPEGKPFSVAEYGRGCRCDGCKLLKRNARLARLGRLEKPSDAPVKRPPGIVWVDPSGITTVVRCERCQKNYGPWVYDEDGAKAFADLHRELHAKDAPFDWSAYDAERIVINRGGRPPLEPDEIEPCAEAGCSEASRAKGLCDTHYRAAKRAAAKAALNAPVLEHNARAEAEIKAYLEAAS